MIRLDMYFSFYKKNEEYRINSIDSTKFIWWYQLQPFKFLFINCFTLNEAIKLIPRVFDIYKH